MVKQAFATKRSWTRKARWRAGRERRGHVSFVHTHREPVDLEATCRKSMGTAWAQHHTQHGKLDERMFLSRASCAAPACYALGLVVTLFA